MKQTSLWKWLILIFLMAVMARLIPGPRPIDDAFITFRYARNIIAGNGFVFNPGETVLGTSTPAYTLLLAALAFLAGGAKTNFPQLAWLLNSLLDGLSVVLIVLIGQKLKLKRAHWGAALAWSIAPFSVTFAIGGLETSLYVFLLLGIFYSSLIQRWVESALLSSLAILTRPDAILLVGPLALHRFVSSTREKSGSLDWNEMAGLLGPYSLWAIFAIYYFGTPIPHSIVAKSSAYWLDQNTALIRLLQHYATPFQGHLTFSKVWIGLGLVGYPFLYLIGARSLSKDHSRLIPFALFPWLYFLAFALANPLIFRWYLTPPLPFIFLFALAGLEKIMDQIGIRFHWRAQTLSTFCFFIIVLFPSLLLSRDWQFHPDHGADQAAPSMAWIKLELLYQDAAEWLLNNGLWDEQKVLAAGDVGVLGYFTDAPILDLVGLNSPESVAYYPLDAEAYQDFVFAISSELILDELPDFLVFQEIYGRHTLLSNDRFLEKYSLLHALPNDIYGSKDMLIFGVNP